MAHDKKVFERQKLTKAERRTRNRKEYFELMLSYLIQFGVGKTIEPFNPNTNHNKMALAKGHVTRRYTTWINDGMYALTDKAREMIMKASKYDGL